jgi:hypothetical protein
VQDGFLHKKSERRAAGRSGNSNRWLANVPPPPREATELYQKKKQDADFCAMPMEAQKKAAEGGFDVKRSAALDDGSTRIPIRSTV